MNYDKHDDAVLVLQLQQSDVMAFDAIYDRYWSRLYGVAYNQIGTREETEDLLQNLFETLWRNRATLKIQCLSAYLVASVKYLAMAYIKSQISLRKFQEFIIFQEIQKSASAEDIMNYSDLQKAVDNALKHLPEKTVEIFKMSRFDNKSVREIAESLDLTEKAVEYHITKSLKVLKEHLALFQTKN